MNKKSDSNLILLLLAVVVAFCGWFFGFNKMNTKSAELDTKIAELNTTITQRKEYKNNSETYSRQTEEFNAAKEVFIKQFPSKILTEDIFAMVRDINKLSSTDDMNVRVQITGGDISEPVQVYSTPDSDMIGFMQAVELSFDATSYEGFKRTLDFINSYGIRCNIAEYKATYEELKEVDADNPATATDSSVGTLQGNILLNMFYLEGSGDERYTAPKPDGSYVFGDIKNPFIAASGSTAQTEDTAGEDK